MAMGSVPDRTEAAEYYFKYIDKVTGTDICRVLDAQQAETRAYLDTISDEQSLLRYAPDKWSVRDVVAHLSDCERLAVFRAFWFARGFDTELPSFDQHVAAQACRADDRPWRGLVEEFDAVRASTLAFFRNLPDDAWSRRGIASGNPFTVRALAFIAAGHVTHHVAILRERYALART
jgi:hypothetical protein